MVWDGVVTPELLQPFAPPDDSTREEPQQLRGQEVVLPYNRSDAEEVRAESAKLHNLSEIREDRRQQQVKALRRMVRAPGPRGASRRGLDTGRS